MLEPQRLEEAPALGQVVDDNANVVDSLQHQPKVHSPWMPQFELSLLGWIIVGLIAGAIASRVVAGRGFGCLADIVVGVIGAFIGGYIVSLFVHTTTVYGFLGSLLVAVLGATLFLAVLKLLAGGRL